MKNKFLSQAIFLICIFCLMYLSNFSKKNMLFMAMFFLALSATYLFMCNEKFKTEKIKNILLVCWLAAIMFFNFATNFFNPKNSMYDKFQADSESLVTGAFLAKENGLKNSVYGLGRFTDLKGITAVQEKQRGYLKSVIHDIIETQKKPI